MPAAQEWEDLLASRLERPVRVEFGRARTTPVLARPTGTRELRVRLHRFFADAPAQVREDLAAWLRAGRRARRACARLDSWIDARLAELPEARPRRVRVQPRGECHDLERLSDGLHAREFAGEFEDREPPGVTWGRRARSRARSSLQLGTYRPSQHLVTMHPVLDQAAVPESYVRFVLFHEILHAVVPAESDARGHARVHTAAFRRRERAYAGYEAARRWERAHIADLIRSARSGRPLRVPPGASRQRLLFEH